MSKSLPARPNLEQLKNQAKELLKSHKSADTESLKRIQANHPRSANIPLPEIAKAKFLLTDAQLVVAREYGFPTWAKLKERVETLLLESADPMDLFKQAFTKNDAATLRKLFAQYPKAKAKINEPVAAYDSHA